ncbi:bifunctional UDP-N-acetylglucosamine diphosphorylase/glucosamine-1-phosphate N-acetyltransferase GlmU [Corynebacterium macginleyi]|uniref:bifunctional UDP-N-acetylglucosamine diphosphorylase/glucosamine-1-phosphate N-acetyltransferase GlmU n=1 Tax=Corynebacterium macginleyi TaxID=38290 RepID=UPI00190A6FA3|nr:bifunctional UDP-N-acetylglucosamine diphosphorylase/glucosamine-1-phosphate N-acetyltransferase GlmU [Corynebacterium macginleyi]MBK4138265.1 bifunctional UDP-N-acetylglucosamine diphosphorylase/glucosamine-1-phosphate N-acetyltransferase GlmU [Corynebacterium macginleyi]MBK4149008.1 bifunctional UDP-N-acetylglucosamine diphosphorylase/glucosamine-1-phosphate N-acetyltransferase GlmU [Corynebacterium macginleyi]MBK4160250.1 bifunctional UDP-N-acetylglucosamine diphosphorylase/glucosamine-1-p
MEATTSSAVVVLAAGAGTRMKSTKQKTLHEIGGRTLLGHALHAAAGINPDHLVTVVGHQRDQVSPVVEKISNELDREVILAVQEEQRGTGHAVSCGISPLSDFEGTIIVTNGDVPLLTSETIEGLRNTHTAQGNAVTVLSMHLADPTGYGRIMRETDGSVSAIVEHKDATEEQRLVDEVNSGVFAFDATALRDALTKLDTDNAQGELYITDVLEIARTAGHSVGAHVAADPQELAGVNDRVQLAAAGRELNRRMVDKAMRGGATIIDPETTWIGVNVTIGTDVTIHPGTQLWGATSIADNAEVGPDSTLTNMQIGTGASVVRTHGSDSVIGVNAKIGPFTFIRPNTIVGEDGKLGGFVEAKNAEIGRGTKVPHLTYIGDATIGEETNIGASSVFVNYDGVNKHHTTIGSHVRTGSDTMFIAPVSVGDGAYSGAGTVIKEDVPAGALVVSGGKQRNIEGWVEKNRPGTPAAEAAARAQDNEK